MVKSFAKFSGGIGMVSLCAIGNNEYMNLRITLFCLVILKSGCVHLRGIVYKTSNTRSYLLLNERK